MPASDRGAGSFGPLASHLSKLPMPETLATYVVSTAFWPSEPPM